MVIVRLYVDSVFGEETEDEFGPAGVEPLRPDGEGHETQTFAFEGLDVVEEGGAMIGFEVMDGCFSGMCYRWRFEAGG